MTKTKDEESRDFVKATIDELNTLAEKADDDGLIVEVPMTPSYYPPILYKRVEPGRWFVQGAGGAWRLELNSTYEHIFQAGMDEGKKWAGY